MNAARLREPRGGGRLLNQRRRRTVGAWCFADHMGPAPVTEDRGVDIGPHPHIGLQTVTWLVAGEILHREVDGFTERTGIQAELEIRGDPDSLSSAQRILGLLGEKYVELAPPGGPVEPEGELADGALIPLERR